MIAVELNPNHPMTNAVREHWMTIAALLVSKAGGHIVITGADLSSFPVGSGCAVEERPDGIHLRIVDAATAHRLARSEGGLPS